MSDAERLQGYVEAWEVATADAAGLLRSLDPSDWEKPTDLPGWDVRCVAAHLAHLESELAGLPQEQVDVPEAAHIKGIMGQFTEMGPIARADWTTDQIVDQFEEAVAIRAKTLHDDPPTEASAPGPGFAALIGWSWETLLSNRPLDVWMHEQDVRRAVGRPGGLDSVAATHVANVFAKSLPYVLAKRLGAAPGTTAVLDVTGPNARSVAAGVGEDGRGAPLPETPADPTTRITIDFESWTILAGGRRTPAHVTARIDGDQELGRSILDNLAVTP